MKRMAHRAGSRDSQAPKGEYMRAANCVLNVFVLLAAASVTSAQSEIESFDGGDFTNPFFNHVLEFDDPCCWEIVENTPKDFELHLRPNFDIVTFKLEPGQLVESVCVTMRDFEGGFVGNSPTSVVIVRSSSNDFVALHVSTLGEEEVLCADVETIGQLFGKPLGDIVQISFQAANEGNSEVEGIGAYYDDITVNLFPSDCPWDIDGDGSTGLGDLLNLLGAWGPNRGHPADFDGDGSVGLSDLLALLANWGPCP